MNTIPSYNRVLAQHFRSIEIQLEFILESTEPEFLHKFRVAIRRFRTLLESFPITFPTLEKTEIFFVLNSIARVPAKVRDIDVQIEYLYNYLNTAQDNAGSVEDLIAELHKQRKVLERGIHEQCLAFRDSQVYKGIKKYFYKFLSPEINETPLTVVAISDPGELITIQKALDFRLHDLLPFYHIFKERVDYQTLHKLRIEMKKLRYTLEVPFTILPAHFYSSIEKIKHIQDYLGEIHDQDIFIRRLIKSLKQNYQGNIKFKKIRKNIKNEKINPDEICSFFSILSPSYSCDIVKLLYILVRDREQNYTDFSLFWKQLINNHFFYFLALNGSAPKMAAAVEKL